MSPLQKPDYNHSLLNTVASILNHYGVTSGYSSLPELKEALSKAPENIVLIVMDGMGQHILDQHMDEASFLRSNIKATLTSVYPCTTTAAVTSYYTGLSPLEHGWIGWSLYFKEYGRQTDIFTNLDSYTKNPVADDHAADDLLAYRTVFERIHEVKKDGLKTYAIMPEGITISKPPTKNLWARDLEGMCNHIQSSLMEPGSKYIYSYWPEPDSTLHHHGSSSTDVDPVLEDINDRLEALVNAAPDDTLFIISADHGQTDILDSIYLNDHPEIMDCFIMPPFIEPRCLSFMVKANKKNPSYSGSMSSLGMISY